MLASKGHCRHPVTAPNSGGIVASAAAQYSEAMPEQLIVNFPYMDTWLSIPLSLLQFMICHSKKCHRPRTSSCHKVQRGPVEQNTGRRQHATITMPKHEVQQLGQKHPKPPLPQWVRASLLHRRTRRPLVSPGTSNCSKQTPLVVVDLTSYHKDEHEYS